MSRIFLAMNGKRINTLDDLRNNFNPDQMLSFYRSGRLQKWLEECGLNDELENIDSFEANYDDSTLLSMLMAVFELDDNQIAMVESMQTPKDKQPVQENKQGNDTAKKLENVSEMAETKETSASVSISPNTAEPARTVVKEEEDYSETGISWHVCQLPRNTDAEHLEASSQGISMADLLGEKNITGPKQRFVISQAFFFEGSFWAKVESGSSYDDTWVKSSDGIVWEKDKEMCAAVEEEHIDDLGKKINVTDRHVFLLGNTTIENKILSYSTEEGWKVKEFDMASVMHTAEYESHLEDVYEGNGYAGIVGVHRWQTGIFKKEYHWSHEVHTTNDLMNADSSDFEENYAYSNYDCDDVSCAVFKDYLIISQDNGFEYASLDQNRGSFSKVEVEGVDIYQSDKILSFKDVVFIFDKVNSWKTSSHKPICSHNGIDWVVCEIDNENVIDIVQAGKQYYAICKGEQNGMVAIYRSPDGIAWEKIQEIRMDLNDDLESICVGGDNTLILFNGSSSGKYLLGRIQ